VHVIGPVLTTAGLTFGCLVLAHAALYLVAGRSPTADTCDAAQRPTLPWRLILTEALASVWLAVTCLSPWRSRFGDATTTTSAVLLVAPRWMPAGALALLGRRLASRGLLVDLVRAPFHATEAHLARIAFRAERLGRTAGYDPALVCFYDGCNVADRIARLLTPAAAIEVMLVAPRIGPGSPIASAPIPTVIRVAGDPWDRSDVRQPPTTIELAGIGHLSLLVAPHVADVIADALRAPGRP